MVSDMRRHGQNSERSTHLFNSGRHLGDLNQQLKNQYKSENPRKTGTQMGLRCVWKSSVKSTCGQSLNCGTAVFSQGGV